MHRWEEFTPELRVAIITLQVRVRQRKSGRMQDPNEKKELRLGFDTQEGDLGLRKCHPGEEPGGRSRKWGRCLLGALLRGKTAGTMEVHPRS